MRTYLFAFILFFMFTSAHAGLERGIRGHVAGDVIAVRTDLQIATWCDFSKQIVVSQTNVLCVYNGSKVTQRGLDIL